MTPKLAKKCVFGVIVYMYSCTTLRVNFRVISFEILRRGRNGKKIKNMWGWSAKKCGRGGGGPPKNKICEGGVVGDFFHSAHPLGSQME